MRLSSLVSFILAFASSSSWVGVKIHGRMMSAHSLYVANPGTTSPMSQNQSLNAAVVTKNKNHPTR